MLRERTSFLFFHAPLGVSYSLLRMLLIPVSMAIQVGRECVKETEGGFFFLLCVVIDEEVK